MVLSHQVMSQRLSGGNAASDAQSWRIHKNRYRYVQAFLDVFMISAVTLALLATKGWGITTTATLTQSQLSLVNLAIALAVGIAGATTLGLCHAYDTRRMGVGTAQFKAIAHSGAFWLLLVLIYFAFINKNGSGLQAVVTLIAAMGAAMTSHVVVRSHLRSRRQQGAYLRRAMVVSKVDHAPSLVEALNCRVATGTEVVEVSLDADPGSQAVGARWRIGGLDHIAKTIDQLRVDVLVISAGAVNAQQLRQIGWQIEHLDVELVVAPAVEEVSDARLALEPVAGTPLLNMELGQSRAQKLAKSLFDRLVSGAALIVLSPLFAIIGLIILFDTGAPIFYRQIRVGHYGKEFSIVKFRTMHVDADARLEELAKAHDGNDVLFKLKEDPRITRAGKFLRRFSLDELPQLWNVLMGQMSLVGPRPPLPREAALYDDAARQRLRAKPGITGLWQVSGRSDLSWDESVKLDIYYADNAAMTLDLEILLRTVRAVVGGKGAY